ncbi:MurR/RpiR family transcriptional regulator [Anaerococcus sp. AGMB09787]|uniref:MurR/RpiR family transcriptional regulator n=1 Tax=Anaerococcus sp. AGMB09787 TaxID=2922869 RepID=UPI001FAF84C5|nr:MurR/RpiR family transcriptional regulator [Anaerococcus sp. AGMB09787]
MSLLNKKVLDTIRDKYSDLYSAEKKVADFILNNPNKSVNMNVSDLSKISKVSEATVVRMCQHLGFKGFYQMKLLLMKDIGSNHKNNENINNPIEFIKSKRFSTFESINYEENLNSIEKLIKSIQTSNNIYIDAAGNTIPIANDLEFRLNRLGFRAFTSQVSEKIINYIINGEDNDIFISISNSGLSKSVLQSSEIANNKNLKSFAITSDISSPLAKQSDYCIFSGNNYLVKYNQFHGTESHIGELFINDIIIFSLSYILSKSKTEGKLDSELEYFSSWKM